MTPMIERMMPPTICSVGCSDRIKIEAMTEMTG